MLLAVVPPFTQEKQLSGGGHSAGFAKLAYSRPDPHSLPRATHTERDRDAQSPSQPPLSTPPSQDQPGPGGLDRVEMDKTSKGCQGEALERIRQ